MACLKQALFCKAKKSVSVGNMRNFKPLKKGVSILTLKDGLKVKFNVIKRFARNDFM